LSIRRHPRSRSFVTTTVVALVASPLAILTTAAPAHAAPVQIQILATNDFHGRLLPNGAEGGAAVLAGAVKQLEAGNPNTVFAAAGDLIGASTFESFIADDEPTIEALNEAGLDVSAAGNHEFDRGYADLAGRVQTLADWEYIAANIVEPDGADQLAESWTQTLGGVKVGFVGAVTEDLPSLVSPAGIQGVTVTDIVAATNAEAAALKAAPDPADVVVLLVHEGAPSTALADAVDPTNAFGEIVNGVSPDVDAIVSGHTHLAYNHSVPVPAWAAEGRPVTERPVVSAGQYGSNLNRLVFTVESTTGDVTAKTQEILPLNGPDPDGSGPGVPPALYPADPATQTIVDAAVAEAEELGKQPLGTLAGAFNRAKLADTDSTENRGGESTLGNLVAEVQRWATELPITGSAQIAFMNPGGLRQDMAGTTPGDFPRTLTYKQAAVVQPFANTLVNMDLTGAKIEEVLEQQWQRDEDGEVPTRPFLRLGASKGFTYTYDPARPEGDRITGMWLNGTAIEPASTYSVTVNSFLASGGDNFRAFRDGTDRKDTGKVDLQAMVDYLAEFAATTPLPVDSTQRAVGVSFPAGAPRSYRAGSTVAFELSSLSFTSPSDVRDQQVTVRLGDRVLGSFPVTTDIQTALPGFDEAGTASVSVRLPRGTRGRHARLTVTGATTGTRVFVPLRLAKAASTVTATRLPKKVTVQTRPRIAVTVRTADGPAAGRVKVFAAGRDYAEALNSNGRAKIGIDRFATPGRKSVRVKYLGAAGTRSDTVGLTFYVAR
jgi:5'-nucleotidase